MPPNARMCKENPKQSCMLPSEVLEVLLSLQKKQKWKPLLTFVLAAVKWRQSVSETKSKTRSRICMRNIAMLWTQKVIGSPKSFLQMSPWQKRSLLIKWSFSYSMWNFWGAVISHSFLSSFVAPIDPSLIWRRMAPPATGWPQVTTVPSWRNPANARAVEEIDRMSSNGKHSICSDVKSPQKVRGHVNVNKGTI